MARGANSKIEVSKKILSTFNGAFLYNDGKEIRIPMIEDGEEIQIKVALTAAKENVMQGDDNLLPGEKNLASETNKEINFDKKEIKTVQPTEAELKEVNDLLQALGL